MGDGNLSDGAGVIVNNNDGVQNLIYNGLFIIMVKVILGKDVNTGEILKLEANNVNGFNPTYEVTQFVPNTGIIN